MAPVAQALAQDPRVESAVCVTAQHREMLDQVLELFEIQPEFDLNLMQPGQSLAGLTKPFGTLPNKSKNWKTVDASCA